MAPLLQLNFLDYGIHKEARFRKVTISSKLPINAGWSAAHVESYFKVSLQLWNLAQFRDLNTGPSDLESSALPPGPRIPQVRVELKMKVDAQFASSVQ